MAAAEERARHEDAPRGRHVATHHDGCEHGDRRAVCHPVAQQLRIALVGTRGVPATYGGFETAVEEVGQRLAGRGHDVTVYCRGHGRQSPQSHLGMRLVHLPALPRKSLETLSHTALSTAHLVMQAPPDVAVVFNAANSPFLPLLRQRGVPVATHMDGLEWMRAKWRGVGRRYYRLAEGLGVRWSDALIADSQGIADYYRREFNADTDLISYGAPILRDVGSDLLGQFGVRPGEFHVAVARHEPENNIHLIIQGALRSAAELPLLVVGSAPYAAAYARRVRELAGDSGRVRLIGSVWDQSALNQLYAHAVTYVHGHSVGGTNPSLLRAMGAGTAVLAYDVVFNRGVLGASGQYFTDEDGLARLLSASESQVADRRRRAAALQRRAAQHYCWDCVTDKYEAMCMRLAREAPAERPSGRRRGHRACALVLPVRAAPVRSSSRGTALDAM